MISLYFGLPGAGKTTLMTMFALRGVKNKKRYSAVYGNVHLSVPGYTYIDNNCVGKYNLVDCLILIDEATLFANSREYKSFDKKLLAYVVQHRHYGADIKFFSQRWNSLDLNIRLVTEKVYYVKKCIIRRNLTKYYRVPYGILFPDPKKTDSQKYGEIVEGYSKPGILEHLFAGRCNRRKYYKYFDSWEREDLPALPKRYKPFETPSKVKKTKSSRGVIANSTLAGSPDVVPSGG